MVGVISVVDLPLAKPFVISGTGPLIAALDANNSTRLRALTKRLAEIPKNAEQPVIKLMLNVSGSGGRDKLVIEARLLSSAL